MIYTSKNSKIYKTYVDVANSKGAYQDMCMTKLREIQETIVFAKALRIICVNA